MKRFTVEEKLSAIKDFETGVERHIKLTRKSQINLS